MSCPKYLKAPNPCPRQLFSPAYSSGWEGKLQTLLQLLRSCSAALEHPPASGECLSTRSPGRSTLLPAWPGLPAKPLAGGCHRTCAKMEPSRPGRGEDRKAVCVHVCTHLCVCAREHPQSREELQHGRMEGQSWASSLLPSFSCALCPEKSYLN